MPDRSPRSPRDRLRRLPAPVRGGLWMLLAAAGFAGMNGVIRLLGETLPALEIAFFRTLGGALLMAPWLIRNRRAALHPGTHRLYVGRSLLSLASMTCWITGVTLLPLALSTALSFTSPLFATVCAVLILGETVRLRRWTATVVGFLGAMIVLRPGIAAFGAGELLILASAAFGALGMVTVKQLTKTEPPAAIVAFLNLYVLPLSLVPALFVWVPPPPATWPWIVLLSAFGVVGHFCMTRAFATTDTSAAMPFDFARLPFVTLIGWFAFGEAPDLWTYVGAAVIVGATVYIAHREAAIARAQAAGDAT